MLTVLRLAVGLAVLLAILGLLTQRWLGLLVSLGVVGFAVTFALQQPLGTPRDGAQQHRALEAGL